MDYFFFSKIIYKRLLAILVLSWGRFKEAPAFDIGFLTARNLALAWETYGYDSDPEIFSVSPFS